jgi:hypothetical protein
LFVLGLRETKPGIDIIHVILPAACRRLIDLDWRVLSAW